MYYQYAKNAAKTVYPGEMVPLLSEDELADNLYKSAEGQAFYLPVHMEETERQFSLEIAVPGVKREEFYIRADKNDLSIRVLHARTTGDGRASYTCFNQHIVLPKNADAEFSYAEYADGLLKVHVHKAAVPVRNVHACIAVY